MSLRTWIIGLVDAVRARDGTAVLARTHAAFGTLAFRALALRMRDHPDGQRILAGRWTFDPASQAALAELAPGTLGRRWADWMHQRGFARVIELPAGPFPESMETRFVRVRWQQTHDLRHVLVGLDTTLHDEAVIAAFQAGMLLNLWSVLVALFGGLASGVRPTALVEAWRAGRQARELAFAPFEELFDRELSEVRAAYSVATLGHLSNAPSA